MGIKSMGFRFPEMSDCWAIYLLCGVQQIIFLHLSFFTSNMRMIIAPTIE